MVNLHIYVQVYYPTLFFITVSELQTRIAKPMWQYFRLFLTYIVPLWHTSNTLAFNLQPLQQDQSWYLCLSYSKYIPKHCIVTVRPTMAYSITRNLGCESRYPLHQYIIIKLKRQSPNPPDAAGWATDCQTGTTILQRCCLNAKYTYRYIYRIHIYWCYNTSH